MSNDRELEKEANVFAACLLIPKKFILEDLRNGIDLADGTQWKNLLKKYGVTSETMTLRLSHLKHQI